MKVPGTFAVYAVLGLAGLLPSCAQRVEPAPTGSPLGGLSTGELQRFEEGRLFFASLPDPEEAGRLAGRGIACATCHVLRETGAGGDESNTHATRFADPEHCRRPGDRSGPTVPEPGSSSLTDALDVLRLPTSRVATARGRFIPSPLYGMGLIEAIPAAALEALADPDDSDRDGISGRVGRTADGRVARFRRKADLATLNQAADADGRYDPGHARSLHSGREPHHGRPAPGGPGAGGSLEAELQRIPRILDFIRFLAPPPRSEPSDLYGRWLVYSGERIFDDIGCADCHVPTLKTGRNAVDALDRVKVTLYSDLLLHDMGPGLADVCGPVATASELRTELLMGLRYRQRFMHDGRARTLRDAIAAHGGEGDASRQAFDRLGPKAQDAVLRFLATL